MSLTTMEILMKPSSIFTKVIYQKRMMVIWWCAAMAAMTMLTLVFFPSFKDSGLDTAFANMPESVQKIVGSMASFHEINAYVNQQIYALRLPLLSIILAVVIFSGLTVGDEHRGLTETQLSLPISRSKLLLQKLAAGMVVTFIATLGILVGVEVALLLIHEHVAFSHIVQSTFACWLVSLCFGLVAYCVGAATGRKGLTVGLASGIAFTSYLVTSMAVSVSQLEQINKLSLFYYYGDSRISWADFALLLGIALVLIVAGIFFFKRRDLQT